MTEKQKKAFLKAEGWKQHQIDTAFWWDPKSTPNPKEFGYEVLPDAYRIASRRRRQREARKLKAAGWWPCYRCGLHKARWTNNKAVALGNCYPKSEALQTLEKQP